MSKDTLGIKILRDHALDYGIELSQSQIHLFKVYLDELKEWNLKINLTGLSTDDQIITELFLDSLIPAPYLPQKGRLLDVGSGAGFPGMALNIYNPDLQTHLLEPISKRTLFLRHVARLLGLKNVNVFQGRIEKDQALLHKEGYDIITSRALSGLSQIIDWCVPLLSYNGILIGFLGKDAEKIIKISQSALDRHGLVQVSSIPYMLPGKDTTRTTVILQKKKGA